MGILQKFDIPMRGRASRAIVPRVQAVPRKQRLVGVPAPLHQEWALYKQWFPDTSFNQLMVDLLAEYLSRWDLATGKPKE